MAAMKAPSQLGDPSSGGLRCRGPSLRACACVRWRAPVDFDLRQGARRNPNGQTKPVAINRSTQGPGFGFRVLATKSSGWSGHGHGASTTARRPPGITPPTYRRSCDNNNSSSTGVSKRNFRKGTGEVAPGPPVLAAMPQQAPPSAWHVEVTPTVPG